MRCYLHYRPVRWVKTREEESRGDSRAHYNSSNKARFTGHGFHDSIVRFRVVCPFLCPPKIFTSHSLINVNTKCVSRYSPGFRIFLFDVIHVVIMQPLPNTSRVLTGCGWRSRWNECLRDGKGEDFMTMRFSEEVGTPGMHAFCIGVIPTVLVELITHCSWQLARVCPLVVAALLYALCYAGCGATSTPCHTDGSNHTCTKPSIFTFYHGEQYSLSK